MGPVYCALVLARVMKNAKIKLEAEGISVSDMWYMDDGQIICKPADADTVLRHIDLEAEKAGETRNGGRC